MKSFGYLAFLPVAFCNLYGFTEPDCHGTPILIDNHTCNGCITLPPQPRIISYRGVDMVSFSLNSRRDCSSWNIGWSYGGGCVNDPNALAARAYVEC